VLPQSWMVALQNKPEHKSPSHWERGFLYRKEIILLWQKQLL
jgi:hypothetical protein